MNQIIEILNNLGIEYFFPFEEKIILVVGNYETKKIIDEVAQDSFYHMIKNKDQTCIILKPKTGSPFNQDEDIDEDFIKILYTN